MDGICNETALTKVKVISFDTYCTYMDGICNETSLTKVKVISFDTYCIWMVFVTKLR